MVGGNVPHEDDSSPGTRDRDVDPSVVICETNLVSGVGPHHGDDDEVGFLSLGPVDGGEADVLQAVVAQHVQLRPVGGEDQDVRRRELAHVSDNLNNGLRLRWVHDARAARELGFRAMDADDPGSLIFRYCSSTLLGRHWEAGDEGREGRQATSQAITVESRTGELLDSGMHSVLHL